MARYTQEELQGIKEQIDLAALIRGKGIELSAHGREHLKGLCPFHADSDPSLIVTPGTNLFHCLGCGAGGDVIEFIRKHDGLSFRHAVELLKDSATHVLGETTARKGRVRKLAVPVTLDADDYQQLSQVIDYYHACLLEAEPAQAYLRERGIFDPEAIEVFKIGYADRTLGLRLPEKNRKAGKRIRTQLQKVGLFRDTGHEHFNGCVVFPVMDTAGRITEVYGRKVTRGLRKGCLEHLYLPGPHKGIWNPGCLEASSEFQVLSSKLEDSTNPQLTTSNLQLQTQRSAPRSVILCESVIDALTFWVNGHRNVTASYGTQGFTPDHLRAFIEHRVGRVYIAYDRDESGDAAALKLAADLASEGIKCYRVRFPKGMDANSYCCEVPQGGAQLQVLLQEAQFMDVPTVRPVRKTPEPSCETTAAASPLISNSPTAQTPPEPTSNPTPGPAPETPTEPTQTPRSSINVPYTVNGDDIQITLGTRSYRIRGLEKNQSFDVMKVNVRVGAGDYFHVDVFDLYNARHRKSFLLAAAAEIKIDADIIKRDLGRILLKLEELQEKSLGALNQAAPDPNVELTDAERAEALELLRSPQLLERTARDIELAGLVGESSNALVAYLAAVSRLTDDPLAVIIQSSSSAGKSSIMDAVLAMMPDEAQIRYTAMTGQSLFYMGETELSHKILAIAEEEGAEQAGYALKILQSEKRLRIASTGKDPKTGRLTTHEYLVEGPCVIFMTTTNIEIDEELQNRCIILTVNEERDQTRRIHTLQRSARTLAGLLRGEDKKHLLRVHANAQRLLRPLLVVNPFAEHLTFADTRLRTRRDHTKYLNLINAVALLHQYQRPIRTVEHQGKPLQYIEVTLSDIEAANRLAAAVMGTSLDDLPPQTRKLLMSIHALASERCRADNIDPADLQLTRRQIREYSGWSDTQLRLHLTRLVELEYLCIRRGSKGRQFVYEVLYRGQGQPGNRFIMQLLDTAELRKKQEYDANLAGQTAHLAGRSRPDSGPVAPTSPDKKNDATPSKSVHNNDTPDETPPKHISGPQKHNGRNHTHTRNPDHNPEDI